MKFPAYASIVATLFFALAAVWLVAPALQLQMWEVAADDSALLVGRRLAAWYLGLGVMFALARRAAQSVARTALVAGFTVACALIAVLGVLELARGHAGPAILLAVAVECVLVLLGLMLLRAERRASAAAPTAA